MDNSGSIELLALRLEDVLRDLIGQHERLAHSLAAKREALSTADQDRVLKLLEIENGSIQAVAEGDKQRQTIVAEMTLLLDADASTPIPMGEMAQLMEEPYRGRLLVLREQLRDRMMVVRRGTAVTRMATESLAKHMQGLLHTIQTVCGGGAAYGAGGSMPPVVTTLSTFTTTA